MKRTMALAVCAALTLFVGCRKMTDKDKTFAVMTALDEASKRYRYDCGHFPFDEVGLKGLVDNPAGCSNWKGPYIEWGMDVTKDAWGRAYIYKFVDEGSASITSYGADGKPGGEGQDADMSFDVKKRQKGMM